ncbi:MAG: SGNH/GDSL hydrolase family protein [Chthoniobacteraceae bacterium]
MKQQFLFLSLLLTSVAGALRAEGLLQPNDFIAVCGDSITEQRRYSVFMEDYFLMCQPAPQLRTAEFGWGGEIVSSFRDRLKNDVLSFQPTVVTTCYGMNDGHYHVMQPKTGEDYRQATTQAIKTLKAAGVRVIVVGSPSAVDKAAFAPMVMAPASADDYNKTLFALRDIAQQVAQTEGVRFADVHTPMMEVMQKAKAAYGDDYKFVAGGGIHPNNNGHLVIAYAFLKALGCEGAIGTITVDMTGGTAQGTPGQKILSFSDRTVSIESSKYPFCFSGDSEKPEQTEASIVRFFPFNEDLNRYQLVVKRLRGTKAKITWGSITKEYSAANLQNGINLAAEFLNNPFCSQFEKVNKAVSEQQAAEVGLIKDLIHGVPHLAAISPGSDADLQAVVNKGKQRERELYDAAVALVVPIRHTIKIEEEP